MANYLVTGGAGFIGSHLTRRLVEEGHRVRVLDNLYSGKLANIADISDRVEFLQGDVANEDDVARAVEGIEVVFHQAALPSVQASVERPLETHRTCVTGTLTLLDHCRRAGIRRLVYAASSSAYGNRPELPKREDHTLEAVSPYGAAKLAGELYCEAFSASYGFETVRLRYFNVFGPGQDPNSPYSAVIPKFVTALVTGSQPIIFGDGSQSRDFIYVDNVVEANLRAAEAEGASGKVYNIASGHALTLLELLQEICNQLDQPFDPRFEPPRPGDVLHSWADITPAERDLGYRPLTSFSEGLHRTIDYYRASINV